jgi:uncharacterized protein (TIGR03000 family)
MTRKSRWTVASVAAAMLLSTAPLHAQHRGGGFYHGGFYHHGPYGWGYRPYGWYRPYPFYGFGLGLGVGLGLGLYAPYYGSYAYPLPPGYVYSPYPAAVIANAPPAGTVLDPNAQPAPQQTPQRPPPDNAGHLQLFVPENAEVYIDGKKIEQTGTTREIVSPPVTPGTRYTYKISVRYTDAQGKATNDTRDITFQANDWFSLDFTRPAPPQATPGVPPPQPLPSTLR